MTARLALIATLCALASGPAHSLSCIPHSVTDTYLRIEQAEERYFVVHGRLTFDEALLPKVDMEDQIGTPPSTDIPAVLSGKYLTKSGFTRPFRSPISLNLQCFGPWCAAATSGGDYLAFIEMRGEDLIFTLNPCGGDGFAEPDRPMLKQVEQCFRGGECEAKFSF